jgi:hypothetical protein
MFNFSFDAGDIRRIKKSSSYTLRDPGRNGADKIQKQSTVMGIKAAKTSKAVTSFSGTGSQRIGKLYGVVVCVNYSDYFAYSLESSVGLFDEIYVVSDLNDVETHKLCAAYTNVSCFKTNIFYEHGCQFDKGSAINHALAKVPIKLDNWILIYDADICFPKYTKKYITGRPLEVDTLYGSPRLFAACLEDYENYQKAEDAKTLEREYNPRGTPIGYFQLFNSTNLRRPNIRTGYPVKHIDASHSDLLFSRKFKKRTSFKSLKVVHLGQDSVNWKGRVTPKFGTRRRSNLASVDEIFPNEILPDVERASIEAFNSINSMFAEQKVAKDSCKAVHIFPTYLAYNPDVIRRNLFAATTVKRFAEKASVFVLPIDSNTLPLYEDDLPRVKDFIDSAFNVRSGVPVIYTNSDICVHEGTYDDVLADVSEHDMSYAARWDIDHTLTEPLSADEVSKKGTKHMGADLFAFTTAGWEDMISSVPSEFLLGRPMWDMIYKLHLAYKRYGETVWLEENEKQASKVALVNVIYHETHDALWQEYHNLKAGVKESELLTNVYNMKLAFEWMKKNCPYETFHLYQYLKWNTRGFRLDDMPQD